MIRSPRWWPRIAVAVGAIWVAAVHGSLWWFNDHPAPRLLWGDEATYLASAARLLAGDPGWQPELLWPSLYPQFLAGLIWLGGGSLILVRIAQIFLLVVAAALLADLTRRISGSRAAGTVAAVVTVGYPPLAAFCQYLWPEVLHLFLFVALTWLLAVRWQRLPWCGAAGLTLGLAVLTKSLLLAFVPVLLATAAWRSAPKAAALRAVVIVGCAVLVTAPTITENQRRLGSPGIAGSALFNLWVGLNDVGREGFVHNVAWSEYKVWRASARDFAGRQEILRGKIVELLHRRGPTEIVVEQLSRQYFRLFDAGCYLTDQLPGGVAWERSRVGYRGIDRRLAGVLRGIVVGCVLTLFVAAPLGLVLGGCRRNRWLTALLLFVAYNLLVFLWLHVTTRYRAQMLPVAFVGIGCLAAWIEARFEPRPSWRQGAAATAIVIVLMVLALG